MDVADMQHAYLCQEGPERIIRISRQELSSALERNAQGLAHGCQTAHCAAIRFGDNHIVA